MANLLLGRLAARNVKSVTDEDVQPVAQAARGAIQPSMPDVTGDMLKSMLDAKDRRPQKSRAGADDYTHVSTLTQGVCPRLVVISRLHDKATYEAVTGGHRLMWKYGRVAEGHIRDQLTDGEAFGFRVYGRWSCACEATIHVGQRPKQDKKCPKCETPTSIYHEQSFRNEQYKVVGNPDLGLFMGRYYIPVEIKSMTNAATKKGKGQWEALEAPLAEHVNQPVLYRELARLAGFSVHDKILMVYAAKEFRFGSPYKVFDVDVTTPPYQRMLAMSLEVASTIRDGIQSGKPPPRLAVCTSPTSAMSKSCDVCSTCWNLPE